LLAIEAAGEGEVLPKIIRIAAVALGFELEDVTVAELFGAKDDDTTGTAGSIGDRPAVVADSGDAEDAYFRENGRRRGELLIRSLRPFEFGFQVG
jgi:hypothetical protein